MNYQKLNLNLIQLAISNTLSNKDEKIKFGNCFFQSFLTFKIFEFQSSTNLCNQLNKLSLVLDTFEQNYYFIPVFL